MNTSRVNRLEAWVVLNAYGNLALFTGLFVPLAAYAAVGLVAFLCVLVPAAAVAAYGVRITSRLGRKVALATRILKQVQEHGYQARLFQHTCSDRCMRLMIIWIHRRIGMANHAGAVIHRYRKNRVYVVDGVGENLATLLATGDLTEQDLVGAAMGRLVG